MSMEKNDEKKKPLKKFEKGNRLKKFSKKKKTN